MRKETIIITFILFIVSLLNYQIIFIYFNYNFVKSNLKLSSSQGTAGVLIPEWSMLWPESSEGYFCSDFKIDPLGNYYLVGSAAQDWGDICLIKFDINRTYQWHELWKDGADFGTSLSFDSLGYIYVLGRSDDNSVLLKYNISGNLEWERIWGDFEPESLAIDSQDNIFVTGRSILNETLKVGLILKYNSTGDLLGNTTSSTEHWITFNDITIDSDDQIYLTGYNSIDCGTYLSQDVLILKYDSSLNLLWNKTWGRSHEDRGYALKIDSLSNIYITGSCIYKEKQNIFLLKYDQSGYLQWNKTLGQDLNNLETYGRGYDLSFDSSDNIYITGRIAGIGAGEYDMIFLKYTKSGKLAKALSWGGVYADGGYGISLDSSNNIYICGSTKSFSSTLNPKMFLLKITSELDNSVIVGYDVFLIIGLLCVSSIVILIYYKFSNSNKAII